MILSIRSDYFVHFWNLSVKIANIFRWIDILQMFCVCVFIVFVCFVFISLLVVNVWWVICIEKWACERFTWKWANYELLILLSMMFQRPSLSIYKNWSLMTTPPSKLIDSQRIVLFQLSSIVIWYRLIFFLWPNRTSRHSVISIQF